MLAQVRIIIRLLCKHTLYTNSRHIPLATTFPYPMAAARCRTKGCIKWAVTGKNHCVDRTYQQRAAATLT